MTSSAERLAGALEPILAAPRSAAVLLDLDGTLAEIAERPEQAVIDERARAALARIADRYALTAIVTGRQASVAREIVGLEQIAYAGNHGFEILAAGESKGRPSPALEGVAADVAGFAAGLPREDLGREGIRFEDKGSIVALHWRGAEREAEAEARVEQIAAEALRRGLAIHRGRKLIELRPSVALDKGTAVTALLAGVDVSAALYAGDDRTDLDAFRALGEHRERGDLRSVIRVGVRSAEGPAEIVERADLTVTGPRGLIPLLEALAG